MVSYLIVVKRMKERFLDRVPSWYRDFNKYDVVLSDDIDGLVSTSALKFSKNWDTKYFYDFQDLYIDNDIYFKENKSATRVWADVAILKNEMAFDNHVSRKNDSDWKNELCINPNLLANISNANYYSKYCGSTALLIWSMYDIPLPTTEEGKMLLLAIDTTFKGYYYNSQFKARNKFYLCDMFGFEELYEVEQRHTSKEFYDLIVRYNLSAKTKLVGGKLHTDIDLETISELLGIPIVLPSQDFNLWRSFNKSKGYQYDMKSVKDINHIITLAFTGQHFAMYSTITKTRS